MADPVRRESTRGLSIPGSVFPFFATGVHFGILQAALFLAVQVYVTATFMGYFVVVLAWMSGVLLSMKLDFPKSLEKALFLSVGVYYVMLVLASTAVPSSIMILLYFLLYIVISLPAGVFFKEFAATTSGRSLFLHENNGFVLGLLLGMFAFVKWGVAFLYLAPVLTAAVTLLSLRTPPLRVFVMLPIATLLVWTFKSVPSFWAMLVISALGLLSCFIRPMPAVQPTSPSPEKPDGAGGAKRRHTNRLLLAICGCNLILLQFFVSREFASILSASELTILIVGIAYFVGFSVGYWVSRWLTTRLLRIFALGMFLLHMAILILAKVVAGYVIMAGFGAVALIGLLFLAAFCTASLYSVFLPKLIDDAGGLPLVSAYSWDLLGAVAGTVAMFVLTALAPSLLWPAYFGLLLVIVWILFRGSAWRPSIAIMGLFLIGLLAIFQGRIQTLATEDYYRTRGYDNPDIVFSGNSFYHSLDVIDTFDDELQTEPESRVSFLNGVRYFRFYYEDGQFSEESRLSEFSYYLAELPAHYLSELLDRPLRVLIMGAGSMYSIRRVAPYASTTTIVEIDPMVVEAAETCWADINQLADIANYEVVFDDVKHFLRTTDERFDLIINDISAPYYLGTALLHGREFFELVSTRLEPNGIFAEALQGRPRANNYDSTPMKIVRGIADVFPTFRVVETRRSDGRRGNQGFIYATSELELTTDGITEIMREDGQYEGTSTFWQRSDHFALHRSSAYSLDNMETLVTGNVRRLKNRLRFDDDEDFDRPGLNAFVSKIFGTDDTEHSRLLAAITRSLAKPQLFGSALAVTLIGLLLGLLPRKRRPRSAPRSAAPPSAED